MKKNFWSCKDHGGHGRVTEEVKRRGHSIGEICVGSTIPPSTFEELARGDGFVLSCNAAGLMVLAISAAHRWMHPIALINWGNMHMPKEQRFNETMKLLNLSPLPEHIKFFDLEGLDAVNRDEQVEFICKHLGVGK